MFDRYYLSNIFLSLDVLFVRFSYCYGSDKGASYFQRFFFCKIWFILMNDYHNSKCFRWCSHNSKKLSSKRWILIHYFDEISRMKIYHSNAFWSWYLIIIMLKNYLPRDEFSSWWLKGFSFKSWLMPISYYNLYS